MVWDLSVQDVARHLGLSEREGGRVLRRALSHLRHRSRSRRVPDELDDEVRWGRWNRRWAQAAPQAMSITCACCGHHFIPERVFNVTGSRPPSLRYCSNTCRQEA